MHQDTPEVEIVKVIITEQVKRQMVGTLALVVGMIKVTRLRTIREVQVMEDIKRTIPISNTEQNPPQLGMVPALLLQ